MSNGTSSWREGVAFGVLGMLGFSGTLVATRVAVSDFSPLTITTGRIVIAAVLAWIALIWLGKTKLPDKKLVPGILSMGIGLAVGYPFFLALALETVPAVHGAVVTGLAPAATAIIAVLRTSERAPLRFWIACAVGFAGVLYFALDAGGGEVSLADGWLLLAMLSLGWAYVEGGRVSSQIGGAVTLSWAMLFLAPAALIPFVWSILDLNVSAVNWSSWVGFGYVGVVSMFMASIFWYRGLAAGGIARIGQINLLLPLAALAWSALLIGEEITLSAMTCSLIVFAAMVVCLKSRVQAKPQAIPAK